MRWCDEHCDKRKAQERKHPGLGPKNLGKKWRSGPKNPTLRQCREQIGRREQREQSNGSEGSIGLMGLETILKST